MKLNIFELRYIILSSFESIFRLKSCVFLGLSGLTFLITFFCQFVEISEQTFDVAVKIVLGVGMFDRDTLREINDCQFLPCFVDHKVKLVIITVDESMFGKFYQSIKTQFKQLFDLLLGGHTLYMTKSVSVDQRHQNSVSVGVDGFRDRKIVLME